MAIADLPEQFPEEDLPGGDAGATGDYPASIEPEAIDPDFPSTPGAPPDPTPDEPTVPDPSEPTVPTPNEPAVPTPGEPTAPEPDEPRAPVEPETPFEPPTYDDTDSNPPSESFFNRSVN